LLSGIRGYHDHLGGAIDFWIAADEFCPDAWAGFLEGLPVALPDLGLYTLKVIFKDAPVFWIPVAVQVAGRVQPSLPGLARKGQHLERVFEEMIAEINVMDVSPRWFGQVRQSSGDPVDVVQVLINRSAQNQVNLGDTLVDGYLADIGM